VLQQPNAIEGAARSHPITAVPEPQQIGNKRDLSSKSEAIQGRSSAALGL
jgi:hypothetical protein